MDSKKPDRRTIRTRKALCEALAQLLTTKELHRITVQEIADKADVNRVTFYKHYLDVYDLYEKLEKEVITEIELVILEGERNPEYMKSLIDYIDENRIYFRATSEGQLIAVVFPAMENGTLTMRIERLYAHD